MYTQMYNLMKRLINRHDQMCFAVSPVSCRFSTNKENLFCKMNVKRKIVIFNLCFAIRPQLYSPISLPFLPMMLKHLSFHVEYDFFGNVGYVVSYALHFADDGNHVNGLHDFFGRFLCH